MRSQQHCFDKKKITNDCCIFNIRSSSCHGSVIIWCIYLVMHLFEFILCFIPSAQSLGVNKQFISALRRWPALAKFGRCWWMMNVQPGLQMRTLTGSCSWAGTTQPDSTWTLERGTQREMVSSTHTHTHAHIYTDAGNILQWKCNIDAL